MESSYQFNTINIGWSIIKSRVSGYDFKRCILLTEVFLPAQTVLTLMKCSIIGFHGFAKLLVWGLPEYKGLTTSI